MIFFLSFFLSSILPFILFFLSFLSFLNCGSTFSLLVKFRIWGKIVFEGGSIIFSVVLILMKNMDNEIMGGQGKFYFEVTDRNSYLLRFFFKSC